MNPTFTEKQKFNKWWAYLLFSSPFLIVGISFILVQFNVIMPKGGEKSPTDVIFIIIFCFLFFIWGISISLKTIINENGINAHFKGIPFCNKKFNWDEIQSMSVIEYSPLTDYGGWGVRMGFNGWCYNVSGKIGIKLTRTNGKPFLIGTQQKEEAGKIINHYFKNNKS
jgi:hypothetical protein